MKYARFPALVVVLSACSWLDRDGEALALLDVTVAPAVGAFREIRFEVDGRPEIGRHSVSRDNREPFKFGYYLPGVSGSITVIAEARRDTCVVGTGRATLVVAAGKTSDHVPLSIAPVSDPGCAAPPPSEPSQPAGATVLDGPGPGDLDVQRAADSMSAHWSGFGDDVAGYEYMLTSGADCQGTPVVPATKVGKGTTYTVYNLALPDGRLTNCIRSFDAAERASRWVASDGIEVDRAPPTVIEYRPAAQATAIKRTDPLVVVFSEPLDEKSVAGQFELTLAGAPVAAAVTLDPDGTTVTVRPDKVLPLLASLTLTVKADVRDVVGNPMARAASATFTTADGTWSAPMELFRYDTATQKEGVSDEPLALRLAAGAGQATVVWEQVTARTDQEESIALYARRFDGTNWQAAQKVADSVARRAAETAQHTAPALVMNDRGLTMMLFEQSLPKAMTVGIRVAAFDLQRGWLADTAALQTYEDVALSDPALAAADVGAHAAWIATPDQKVLRIYAARHDGQRFDAPRAIDTPYQGVGTQLRVYLQLASDPMGNAHAVWGQSDGFGDDIVATRFTIAGGWSPPVVVSPTRGDIGGESSLVVDGQGNATLVWRQQDATRTLRAFAAYHDAGTGKWGAATPGTDANTPVSRAASNAGGQTVVVLGKGRAELTVRRIERGVWSPKVATQAAEAGTFAGGPRIGVDGAGHALVLFVSPEGRLLVARETAAEGLAAPVELSKRVGDRPCVLTVLPGGGAFATWEEGTPAQIMVARFE